MKKILVVDDEREIADLLEVYLCAENYQVFKYYTGADAFACTEREELNLAILDVMLPDIDGFSLCRKIRESHFYPVIMLTARTEDMDKITGLTMGADDYITKPFSPLEVVTRVKVQLRRCEQYNRLENPEMTTTRQLLEVRGLVINKDSHRCMLNGKLLALTPIEFSLLWYLCKNQGKVISSEELFEAVWGERFLDGNNTVMAHIGRLREKMNDSGRRPKYIKTVWGVGYQIE